MNFKAERLNRGLSQRRFAEALGVSRRVVQRLEDTGSCDPANRLKVARYFGVQVTDLWPVDGREAA